MKLKLTPKGDVFVLEVQGEINAEGTAVLKAGITKLLRTGKNRIVIDLVGATPQEAIQPSWWNELRDLNQAALELDGGIVLAGLKPSLQKAFSTAAGKKAPFLADTAEAGAKHFKGLKTVVEDPPIARIAVTAPPAPVLVPPSTPAPALATVSAAAPAAQASTAQPAAELSAPGLNPAEASAAELSHVKKLQEEIVQLKETIVQKERGELQALKKEVAVLQERNTQLIDQLEHLMVDRRTPADKTGWEEKTVRLETELEEALKKVIAKK